MQNGFLRLDGGALVTVPNASRVDPVRETGGWIVDANGHVVTIATGSQWDNGKLVDPTDGGLLRTVAFASAVAPLRFQNGLLRDANGSAVTVSVALAAAPTRFQNGNLVDANGALVVDD